MENLSIHWKLVGNDENNIQLVPYIHESSIDIFYTAITHYKLTTDSRLHVADIYITVTVYHLVYPNFSYTSFWTTLNLQDIYR